MNVLRSNPGQRRILWIAVGLALLTALTYTLIAWNILGVGDLQMSEKPAGIIYFAAGCYLAGGLLILLQNRGLLLFGAFINAMVLLFFFNMYRDRPAVILSPGGLISKAAQVLLEVALIFVVVLTWQRVKHENPGS